MRGCIPSALCNQRDVVVNIPENKFCPICGGIIEYNCLTIMRDHLGCKCKKGDKMKHELKFSHLDQRLNIAYYKCGKCSKVRAIDLEHPETFHLVVNKDDCEEISLRDIVGLLRTPGQGYQYHLSVADALANISDRLDKLEVK